MKTNFELVCESWDVTTEALGASDAIVRPFVNGVLKNGFKQSLERSDKAVKLFNQRAVLNKIAPKVTTKKALERVNKKMPEVTNDEISEIGGKMAETGMVPSRYVKTVNKMKDVANEVPVVEKVKNAVKNNPVPSVDSIKNWLSNKFKKQS